MVGASGNEDPKKRALCKHVQETKELVALSIVLPCTTYITPAPTWYNNMWFICAPCVMKRIVYHCVSMCINVYHCVSLCIIVYHCVSMCIIVYHCVLLCIIVWYHCVSHVSFVCIIVYHVYHCVSLSQVVILRVHLFHPPHIVHTRDAARSRLPAIDCTLFRATSTPTNTFFSNSNSFTAAHYHYHHGGRSRMRR